MGREDRVLNNNRLPLENKSRKRPVENCKAVVYPRMSESVQILVLTFRFSLWAIFSLREYNYTRRVKTMAQRA